MVQIRQVLHLSIGHNEVDILVIVHHYKSFSHVVPCNKGNGRVAKSVYSVKCLYAFVGRVIGKQAFRGQHVKRISGFLHLRYVAVCCVTAP